MLSGMVRNPLLVVGASVDLAAPRRGGAHGLSQMGRTALPGSSLPAGAYCGVMRLAQMAQILVAEPLQVSKGPHTAGWLSWFVVGAVVLIVGIAWFCLRGYRDSSDGGE